MLLGPDTWAPGWAVGSSKHRHVECIWRPPYVEKKQYLARSDASSSDHGILAKPIWTFDFSNANSSPHQLSSTLVALGATLTAALTPLEVQGNAFVNPKTGNKFQIVGVDYQINGAAGYDPAHGHDPLSEADVCLRDAAIMQALGVNAIRVYNLDPNLNHDECASIFNAAGMYMLIDVNSPLPGEAITAWQPWTSYYMEYLNRTFAMVEAFKSYPNTLLFFSANEVINNEATVVDVPPYLRAVTRDLKNYIANHADRKIPVGYSAADVREYLWDTWNYMQCTHDEDKDDMSRADLFGLNSYSWCGESDFEKSSYDDLVDGLKDTSVPVFLSEYGCNKVTPRPFTEVGTIYGDQMTGVFSGGLVYEFSQETHKFGLAQVFKNNSVHLLEDYHLLAEQYAKLDFNTLEGTKPSKNSPKPPKCDASLIKTKEFNANFTLPVVPPGAQELIDNGIENKPSGKLVKISNWEVDSDFKIWDANWNLLTLSVKPLADDESNKPGNNEASTASVSAGPTSSSASSPASTSNGGTANADESAGISVRPAVAFAIAAPIALLLL